MVVVKVHFDALEDCPVTVFRYSMCTLAFHVNARSKKQSLLEKFDLIESFEIVLFIFLE